MESEEKYYVIQLTKSPGDYRNYVYGPYDKDDAEKICKKDMRFIRKNIKSSSH